MNTVSEGYATEIRDGLVASYETSNGTRKRFLYSGGLDTSVILGWLKKQGYDVHAAYIDLGQPCDRRRRRRHVGAPVL